MKRVTTKVLLAIALVAGGCALEDDDPELGGWRSGSRTTGLPTLNCGTGWTSYPGISVHIFEP